MFGVVPKPLWERRVSADERNRIQLGMRCLLVEHDDGLVLVDTGIGNKEGAKFHDIYGIENAGGGGRTWLESSLASLGFGVDDVRWVVNTHLHFDHAGGNTWVDDAGSVRATFPRARSVVQRGEHAFATATNERTAASYFPHNWEPILAGGQFDLLDGEQDVVPGIRVIASGGHVPYHQSVLVDGGGGTTAGSVTTFTLGPLAPGASAQRSVIVRYAVAGTKTSSATVSTTVVDPVAGNTTPTPAPTGSQRAGSPQCPSRHLGA